MQKLPGYHPTCSIYQALWLTGCQYYQYHCCHLARLSDLISKVSRLSLSDCRNRCLLLIELNLPGCQWGQSYSVWRWRLLNGQPHVHLSYQVGLRKNVNDADFRRLCNLLLPYQGFIVREAVEQKLSSSWRSRAESCAIEAMLPPAFDCWLTFVFKRKRIFSRQTEFSLVDWI
jgi:hypothetical protein